ncbi:MAG: hypothetical protein WHX93_01275 [bacterium]
MEKKEKLFSPKTTPEEARIWGDRFREAQRVNDAAAFYRRAGYEEGLEGLRQKAIDSGDLQLFEETLLSNKEGNWNEEIRKLAKRAEEKGRWSDARRAYSILGDELGLKRAEAGLKRIMEKVCEQDPGGQGPGEGL